MARFLAITSRGLVDVLKDELSSHGYKVLKAVPSGVYFESNWKGLYKAHLLLKTSTRILLPVLSFDAFTEDEIYSKTLKHDFTKYIDVNQTLVVNTQGQSDSFKDNRYISLKVKDALVDQFREKFGQRPNVDKDNPDLKILVKIYKNQFDISIDLTGESLSQRGYRVKSTDAPLREHLARGILDISGWATEQPLVDPMCGSGTFVIEAALKAIQGFVLDSRRDFSFQHLKNFDPEVYKKVLDEVIQLKKKNNNLKIYAFDKSFAAIENAKQNAQKAGVSEFIQFKQMRLEEISSSHLPQEPGVILVNPPYGERLGKDTELEGLFTDMGRSFKNNFKGWQLWLLSGNSELSPFLGLKSNAKKVIFNGPIECRLLCYDIR
ncbi:MAG: methyltransferase [Bdellovibrionales bacterium]|nr:methyltransferase [Bdellovibrionales bacterium]